MNSIGTWVNVGKRYGKLLVWERIDKEDSNHIFWHCICDCGRSRVVRNSELYEGTTRHCGVCTARKKSNQRRSTAMT